MLTKMVMMEPIVGLLLQVELECMFLLLVEVVVLLDTLEAVQAQAVEVEALELLVLMLLALVVEQVVSLLLLEELQVVIHQAVKVVTVEAEP